MEQGIVFQVSEFIDFLNETFGQMGEVVVEGEISEINVSQNKWLFLTIKDEESSVSVFAVISRIAGWTSFEAGMKVKVFGTARIHKKSGRFSLTARDIVPSGEGALRIAFEKLKAKLDGEGLFDVTRKRPIPKFPQRIGLITARDSRAYGDFVKILSERMGGIHVFFYPVNVQGNDSVPSIAKAFLYFAKHKQDIELLALVRGGGSLEDLQSFNDERVCRAIFSSPVPVVVGVGHEDDVSLADLVADVRASTPTNAAELIAPDREHILSQVRYMVNKLESVLSFAVQTRQHENLQYIQMLSHAFSGQITHIRLVIDACNRQFQNFTNTLQEKSTYLAVSTAAITTAITHSAEKDGLRLATLTQALRLLDYENILARGFSITRDERGTILKDSKGIKSGQNITTQFKSGTAHSTVFTPKKGYA